jgi:hypothetical protein
MRGAAGLAAALALAACGGGAKSGGGGAGAGGSAGGAGVSVAAGGTGGGGDAGGPVDGGDAAPDDGKLDQATDFGEPAPDVAVRCPTATGALAPAPAALVIDDFDGTGKLDGRIRATDALTVREQFDATAGATFAPAPAIEPTCGAAAPGAAHIRGRAADTGATFALVFATPAADKPLDHFDASATTGVSLRIALGGAAATKLVSVQVNLAQSKWDYTADITIAGTAWQTVTIPWSELQAAPGAPAFSPATLNQIVFPFFAGADVDVYLDDIAFVK